MGLDGFYNTGIIMGLYGIIIGNNRIIMGLDGFYNTGIIWEIMGYPSAK
jgi:hypothetical protein